VTAGEPILRVEGLLTVFPSPAGAVRAVDGIDFDLRPCRVLGMVGESGSGKSMAAFSILRLVPRPGRVAAGRIEFDGRDLLRMSAREMRSIRGAEISMIFQNPMTALNPVLRVDTQILEALRAHRKLDRRAARREAAEALSGVGISDPERRLRAYPHQLSGGMRQRVAIAIALLHRPRVILADEPTTALDVTVQAQILRRMRRRTREAGAALLWITHDLAVVAGLADEIAVMYAGWIVEHGPADEVLDRPLHPYTVGLIGAVPRRGKPLYQIPGAPPSRSTLPPGCPFQERCPRADAACQTPPPETRPRPDRRIRCFHPHGGGAAESSESGAS
jgi:peptide/nickel transport system ATP-binding protein